MCSAAEINWPTKIRSVYGISERATTHDIVNDVLLKDRLVQMWPDYPCLYDVRTIPFKSRNVRQLAMEERLYMRSYFINAASQHAVATFIITSVSYIFAIEKHYYG